MATHKMKEPVDPKLLDELLAGKDPQTVLTSEGLLGDLKRALAQRMLNTELDVHLEQAQEQQAGNHRNGSSPKTVLTEDGPMELSIPRDRHGRFDPALIRKYQRRFPGFDQKIIALYARGMSTRDIQAHVAELYGLDISPDLVSAVTDCVIEEVQAWQGRPLDPHLCGGVLRCAAGQDSRRRPGAQQGGVPGYRNKLRGIQGCPGHLGRAKRRREVLAEGDE
jgi:putative transposase